MLDQYAVVQIDGSRVYNAWDQPVFVSASDLRETLRSINAGLRITNGSSSDDSSFSFREWRAPGAVVLLALATWRAVLLLLVFFGAGSNTDPEPANRRTGESVNGPNRRAAAPGPHKPDRPSLGRSVFVGARTQVPSPADELLA